MFVQTKHEGTFRDYKLSFKDSTNRALMSPEDAIKLVKRKIMKELFESPKDSNIYQRHVVLNIHSFSNVT